MAEFMQSQWFGIPFAVIAVYLFARYLVKARWAIRIEEKAIDAWYALKRKFRGY